MAMDKRRKKKIVRGIRWNLFKVFIWIAEHLPLKLSCGIASLTAIIVYFFARSERRKAYDALSVVFPGMPLREKDTIIKSITKYFAQSPLEVIYF